MIQEVGLHGPKYSYKSTTRSESETPDTVSHTESKDNDRSQCARCKERKCPRSPPQEESCDSVVIFAIVLILVLRQARGTTRPGCVGTCTCTRASCSSEAGCGKRVARGVGSPRGTQPGLITDTPTTYRTSGSAMKPLLRRDAFQNISVRMSGE